MKLYLDVLGCRWKTGLAAIKWRLVVTIVDKWMSNGSKLSKYDNQRISEEANARGSYSASALNRATAGCFFGHSLN